MAEAGVLERLADDVRESLDAALEGHSIEVEIVQAGTVRQVERGVARVSGLPNVGAEELLLIAGDIPAIAFNLDRDEVGVVLLGDSDAVEAGADVRATGRLLDTPVGEALKGRVLDALGRPLDGAGPIETDERWPVERDAPAIVDRTPVTRPLQTGIKIVDALFPIGRGQRELIAGDRQIGKTTIAVDAMINQPDDVVSIYCAIGQRATGVARVIESLRAGDAMARSIIVVASGESEPGLQYLTPYAAMTMAEYFMARGTDVLLVLDDLTRHARAYRELSLLLRRPPGREAYPGDIFYLHSRLLERSASVRDAGSITTLPIVETQAQDIAAYIPTNLISITDGQLYLSPVLMRRGALPAIDVGRSVSRVGGKAQLAGFRAVAGDLRLAYAQFEELESFSRFATRLDPQTRATIERGRRVREIFKQPEHRPLSVAEQVAVLRAVNEGLFDPIELADVDDAEHRVRRTVTHEAPGLCARIENGEALEQHEWETIDRLARSALERRAKEPVNGDV